MNPQVIDIEFLLTSTIDVNRNSNIISIHAVQILHDVLKIFIIMLCLLQFIVF